MRINVYAEEITGETAVVVKAPDNHPGVHFYGVRMYLDSPSVLHRTDDDDDRSAITIWVPWTKEGHDWTRIQALLDNLVSELNAAEATEFERVTAAKREQKLFQP
jgi:hypothetical protein